MMEYASRDQLIRHLKRTEPCVATIIAQAHCTPASALEVDEAERDTAKFDTQLRLAQAPVALCLHPTRSCGPPTRPFLEQNPQDMEACNEYLFVASAGVRKLIDGLPVPDTPPQQSCSPPQPYVFGGSVVIILIWCSGRRRPGDPQHCLENMLFTGTIIVAALAIDIAFSDKCDLTQAHRVHFVCEKIRMRIVIGSILSPPCATWTFARFAQLLGEKGPLPLRYARSSSTPRSKCGAAAPRDTSTASCNEYAHVSIRPSNPCHPKLR